MKVIERENGQFWNGMEWNILRVSNWKKAFILTRKTRPAHQLRRQQHERNIAVW